MDVWTDARWLDVLPRYGRLRIDLADDRGRLLGVGLPDRRLDTLATQYEDLIGRVDTVTDDESRRLRRALNVHRFASALAAPYREEHLDGVGRRLRMLLAGFD